MKANKTVSNTTDADLAPISKTKRKAEADAVQDIGVKLVELSKDKLNKLNLPEALMDAVLEAKRITANGATRRQKQYIGSLMRNIDVEPIKEQLEKWEGKNTAENAYFHQLERWRERLIADANVLQEFLTHYPHADIQQIRTLARNAQKEAAANKPPKSSRELFKLLREVTEIKSSDNLSDD